jgi:hypothetical protein
MGETDANVRSLLASSWHCIVAIALSVVWS